MRSMAQQLNSMNRKWPTFDAVQLGHDHTIWFGNLVSIQKQYRVMVEFGLPSDPQTDSLHRRFPLVRVLSPELKPNFDAPEEAPLPHVYFDKNDLPNSPLCLFDPEANEWSHNDLVALTTIPWTCDWLVNYEGWLATGRWFGGGRHATPQSQKVPL
jgi:hypothetical protein